MLSGAMPMGEMFRYTIIEQGPRIPRTKEDFSPDQYLVCQVDDEYIPGRLLEISGRDPAVIKICMNQGRTVCSWDMGGCEDDGCPFRLLTTADNGAVLTAEDIIFGVLEGNPYYGFINSSEAERIFDLIAKLEKRQSGRKVAQA